MKSNADQLDVLQVHNALAAPVVVTQPMSYVSQHEKTTGSNEDHILRQRSLRFHQMKTDNSVGKLRNLRGVL